jgi:hypothetical protein
LAAAGLSAVFSAPCAHAQSAANGGSTAITRGSDVERKLNLAEPSLATREERLKVQPLDWTTTIGKPTPRKLTATERKLLKNAKPTSSGGGAPHPEAEAEARRLHPEDWK